MRAMCGVAANTAKARRIDETVANHDWIALMPVWISRMPRRLWLAALMFLPSRIKIELLRLRGHHVSRRSRIGLSWLDVQTLRIADGARIGSFNVFKGLAALDMAEEAEIGKFNQFTASPYYESIGGPAHGRVSLGHGAIVTMRHYFDCQSSISIGADSLVAGIRSVFFTHQKGIRSLNEAAPITIGPRVYVGAACVILPGASVRGRAYLSSGSIIAGNLDQEDAVYASPRAVVVKSLSSDAAYFSAARPTARFDQDQTLSK